MTEKLLDREVQNILRLYMSKMNSGDKIISKTASWSFRGNTFKKFDAHINKSVPLYNECRDIYLKISDFFLQDKSRIIDIGSSTGTFLIELTNRHKKNDKTMSFEGYDTVKQMIDFSKKKAGKKSKIKFFKKNVLSINFRKSCIVSSFYTLQFIPQNNRQFLVNKIYKELNWGGAFFLIEKVRGPDARFQDILNQIYMEYKTDKGYTAGEILSKSKSLKGVLEPFSSQGNLDMLKRLMLNLILEKHCI